MFLLLALLIIASLTLIILAIEPFFTKRMTAWHEEKEEKVALDLDKMFSYDRSPAQIMRLYFILPPILGLVGFLFWGVFGALAGVIPGLLIPNAWLSLRLADRKRKLNRQLLDLIMIMSSALKGGLSILQALEVVVEEMPAPMNQEVGLLVRENRMGVTLEEALKRFKNRAEIEELDLVVNSILVARETGGDLTKVLSRLTSTIRDNRKLKDSVRTLTLQGRLQGIIMSVLPFFFIGWVVTFNRAHFDILLKTDTGRTLLMIAVVLQIVGMILIKKFSTIRI